MTSLHIVIVGGGIAGTTCAEYISSLSFDVKVTIIAATDIIKTAATTQKITRLLDEINVSEKKIDAFEHQFPNVSVKVGVVTDVHCDEKYVVTSRGEQIKYDKLCLCTGGKPRLLAEGNPHVVIIRDTDTVETLQKKLSKAKKIAVIGNGGIALELAYEILGCEIIWCIKDDFIGTKYLDKGASTFMLPSLDQNVESESSNERKADTVVFKRKRYETERDQLEGASSSTKVGSALGPDWCINRTLHGDKTSGTTTTTTRNVQVKYNSEINNILTNEECKKKYKENENSNYNVYVELKNGEVIGSDLVVCATGVTPNVDINILTKTALNLSEDGGICVDDNMRTNIPDVYAAGDVCEPIWDHAAHWFPMKLWTQGWQMGAFAGKCIVDHINGSEQLPLDFCFELFTHATTFFGYKICLLGAYNCQKLEGDYEFLVRYTEGLEYIKLVMMNGRVQGAILIGETDLEETIENLILNQLDVGFLGESLLDPDVDIEDYFD